MIVANYHIQPLKNV